MKDYVKINRLAYDQLATEFASRHDQLLPFQVALKSYLLEYVKISDNVLEIGSGTGMALQIFDELQCNTVAIELAPKMCEVSKQNAPKAIIINQNVLETSFYGGQFDLVCAFAVIHTFPFEDAKKILLKVKTWLKVSGIFIFDTMYNETNSDGVVATDDSGNIYKYQRKYTEQELEELVNFSGLQTIDKRFIEDSKAKKTWIRFACQKL